MKILLKQNGVVDTGGKGLIIELLNKREISVKKILIYSNIIIIISYHICRNYEWG